MATLSTRDGVHQIQWKRGKLRKTLSIGRMNKKQAQVIRSHVEQLIASAMSGQPLPPDTAGWLGVVGEELYAKLFKLELVAAERGNRRKSLKIHIDEFIKSKTGLKPRTIIIIKQARRHLLAFFGDGRTLDTITKGDVRDFKRSMDQKGLAPSTVTGLMKKATQVFEDAVERELIRNNPFNGVKLSPQVNDANNVYVPAADVKLCIDACPDAEWRLLFALSRFAGLRIPSEIRNLKWSAVYWDRDRMRIESPKTEHHQGKDHRIIPIFADVLPYLRESFELAKPGEVYVLPRLRKVSNHTTTGAKIIARAGLTKWPRTFQNLRASCETDLATALPFHVACKFIGNSEKVAMKHYTSVNDEHFKAGSALHFALHAPAEQTPTEPKESAISGLISGEPSFSCPRQGSNSPAISRRKQQLHHLALQEALHPKQKQAQRLLGRLAHRLKLKHSPARKIGGVK